MTLQRAAPSIDQRIKWGRRRFRDGSRRRAHWAVIELGPGCGRFAVCAAHPAESGYSYAQPYEEREFDTAAAAKRFRKVCLYARGVKP